MQCIADYEHWKLPSKQFPSWSCGWWTIFSHTGTVWAQDLNLTIFNFLNLIQWNLTKTGEAHFMTLCLSFLLPLFFFYNKVTVNRLFILIGFLIIFHKDGKKWIIWILHREANIRPLDFNIIFLFNTSLLSHRKLVGKPQQVAIIVIDTPHLSRWSTILQHNKQKSSN